jgi:transketolase
MGTTAEVMSLNSMSQKFSAFGFDAVDVDGHDEIALDKTVNQLKQLKNGKPKAIVAKTQKGKGVSFMENNNEWHYTRLTEETFRLAMTELEQSKEICILES